MRPDKYSGVTMTSKIMIVDPVPDRLAFSPEALQRAGYALTVAAGGSHTLALAEELRPDVILMDIANPETDGITTCQRLHLNPATANIPVMILSARGPAEAHAEALLAGAAGYITTSMSLEDVLLRLQNLLRTNRVATVDQTRLLESMAYTTLSVLPVEMAWILTIDRDSHTLVHQAVAIDRSPDASALFLPLLQELYPNTRLPLERGSSALADVVRDRRVFVNVPTGTFNTLSGGESLQQIFDAFNFRYISALPLITSGQPVGVMVLATEDDRLVQSRRAQQTLNALSSQTAMIIDNARLLADLARRETQMRAEQTFRQLVLDTMGEGLLVLDHEARITYANRRLLTITGYTPATLYGQYIDLLIKPDTGEVSHDNAMIAHSEMLHTRAGHTLPVYLSRVSVPASDGSQQLTVIVITDLTDLQRNESTLRIQTQRLQAINRAANAISSASSFEDVIQITLEAALQVVQGVSGTLFLRDTDNLALLIPAAAVGPHAGSAYRRYVVEGQGVIGRAVETAQSQLITNLTPDDEQYTEYDLLAGPKPESALVVPLIAFDEVVGAIEILNKSTGPFDEQDLSMLESLSVSTAITIENTRLFEQTRRQVTELSTLLDASSAVTSTLNFGDILERITRQLSHVLQVQRVVITDWHPQSNRLVTLSELVNVYWNPDAGPAHTPQQVPVTYAAIASEQPVIVDPDMHNAASAHLDERNASGLYAIAGFPLRLGNEIVGALTLYAEQPCPGLASIQAAAVLDVIMQWQELVAVYEPSNWLSRPNLTDLCQQALRASSARWSVVMAWDPRASRLCIIRELGFALWSDRTGQHWTIQQYSTLAGVLETGKPLVIRAAELVDDPAEQNYLARVGGQTSLIAPLFIRGEPSGLVKLIDTQPQRVFDEAAISLCQGIANVVGNAIENAQLYTLQEQRASALEAAYKELQDADQLKNSLLQNLSHELRTPLTHILGYLRLMQDEAFGALSDAQQETLELVTNKAQNLADLVENIVAVQDAETLSLLPQPTHLDRVITAALRTVQAKAESQNIQIVPRIPVDLPLIYADAERLRDVFEELLGNAIKFSPTGTHIAITINDPGGLMLQISIHDHGIGIPAGEHEKIFRRFYQVESGTTRRFGGTGLGLAVVRQIIEGHNGRVWVESTLGEGSSFHFTLPKASAATV